MVSCRTHRKCSCGCGDRNLFPRPQRSGHGNRKLSRSGAGGRIILDVTVNGLGDRAGNAGLEQVAVALHLKGVEHGVRLDLLRELSRAVEEMSLVPVSKLAPIVGDFAFCQKSPSHLESPALFETFEPGLIGTVRRVCEGH